MFLYAHKMIINAIAMILTEPRLTHWGTAVPLMMPLSEMVSNALQHAEQNRLPLL